MAVLIADITLVSLSAGCHALLRLEVTSWTHVDGCSQKSSPKSVKWSIVLVEPVSKGHMMRS